MIFKQQDITAVILAGGKASRMNGANKGLLLLNNKPLIEYVLASVKSQSLAQIINVNSDFDTYKKYGCLLVSDDNKDFQGPLSGLISCKNHIKSKMVLTVPCDTPFLPDNLVSRMLKTYNQQKCEICVVHDGQQTQNLILLFATSLLDKLETFFTSGNRKVSDWIHQHDYCHVDFSEQASCFININTPNTLKLLQNTNGSHLS